MRDRRGSSNCSEPVPQEVASYAGDQLGLYVGAYALEEALGIDAPSGEDPTGEAVHMVRQYCASLPPRCPPRFTAMVEVLVSETRPTGWNGTNSLVLALAAAAV